MFGMARAAYPGFDATEPIAFRGPHALIEDRQLGLIRAPYNSVSDLIAVQFLLLELVRCSSLRLFTL